MFSPRPCSIDLDGDFRINAIHHFQRKIFFFVLRYQLGHLQILGEMYLYIWWFIELANWFNASFLLNILGILTTSGGKRFYIPREKGQITSVKHSLRYVRLSHQSELCHSLILNCYCTHQKLSASFGSDITMLHSAKFSREQIQKFQ